MMKLLRIILIILCFGCDVAFLCFQWKITVLSVLLSVACFLVCSTLQMVIHELGHLIGGKCSGYRFVYLQLSAVQILSDRAGKLHVSVQNTHGGQCVMAPRDNPHDAETLHYKRYNMGGVVANGMVMLLGCLLFLCDAAWCRLLLINFLFASVLKIVGNLLPSLQNGVPNDGYIVRLLKHHPVVRRDYAVYLSLFAALFWEETVRPEDYDYLKDEIRQENERLYYDGIRELLTPTEDGEAS